MHRIVITLTVGALLAAPRLVCGAAVDVYLFAGQSNMDGRGKAMDLSAEQRKPFETVLIFYRNPPVTSAAWKPLAPGFSVPPDYKPKTLPAPTFGPEIGFAQVLVRTQPAQRFAFIKVSKGGTSLSKDWNPDGGPCYRNFIETVALATKALAKDGHTATMRGLLWHQGESDAHATTTVYQQQLTAFIARVREDLHRPDLPFVIGEVFDNGKRNSIRTAQRAVAAAVPHVGFASAEDLKTWDNGTHFDAASQLKLGERFAEAMLKLLK